MAARPLLPQNNLSAAVLADNVERVLTEEMSRSLLNIAKRPLPLTLRGVGLTSKDAVS